MIVRPIFCSPTVQAIVPLLTGVAFDVGFYPGDGGGYFAIEWGITDPIGGEYIEIEYDITAGDPITTTGPGGPVGPFTTSPSNVNVSLGANPSASATVRLYSASATLLDTVVLPNQVLPI